ncbi:unnamed protein product, partial [Dicrocoelium dendriticum]
MVIYNKCYCTKYANYRDISLTPAVTKLLASIFVHRLTEKRGSRIREELTGFQPGERCIDHIFTVRQMLEQRHTYRRSTITVFLDFTSALDSVNRRILHEILVRKGVPIICGNILRALYSNTTGGVRVYGDLSDAFRTTIGVSQSCPISPFLFNFGVDCIVKCSFAELHDVGVEVLSSEKPVYL